MEKLRNPVQVKFTDRDIERIDALIEKDKFDKRTQIIRRAVHEFLEKMETPVYA